MSFENLDIEDLSRPSPPPEHCQPSAHVRPVARKRFPVVGGHRSGRISAVELPGRNSSSPYDNHLSQEHLGEIKRGSGKS